MHKRSILSSSPIPGCRSSSAPFPPRRPRANPICIMCQRLINSVFYFFALSVIYETDVFKFKRETAFNIYRAGDLTETGMYPRAQTTRRALTKLHWPAPRHRSFAKHPPPPPPPPVSRLARASCPRRFPTVGSPAKSNKIARRKHDSPVD